MNRADKKALADALDEAISARELRMRNLGVMARAPAGAWPMPPSQAARRLAAIKNKMKALKIAITKMGLE